MTGYFLWPRGGLISRLQAGQPVVFSSSPDQSRLWTSSVDSTRLTRQQDFFSALGAPLFTPRDDT